MGWFADNINPVTLDHVGGRGVASFASGLVIIPIHWGIPVGHPLTEETASLRRLHQNFGWCLYNIMGAGKCGIVVTIPAALSLTFLCLLPSLSMGLPGTYDTGYEVIVMKRMVCIK